ncbi:hypothetical protein PR003_g22574 [Phytophthora rubi]|uniref:Uncharacterized protein n=1 Tax=Phytophthora rubi TaxID=129364 RepID=A0A6A4D7B2_9STRA|nr:hypothetical protein PR003_g22574 [Phytophthora rubi]
MAVTRINREITGVDLTGERGSPIIPVYLDSEDQALRSKWVEWIEGTIYIVEVPSQEHEYFNDSFKTTLATSMASSRI